MDIPGYINPLLRQYVEDAVLPRYDSFDKGHQRNHDEYVIGEALKLSRHYDVDSDMIYAAMNAAWGGISGSNQVSACISAEHKTTKNLLKTGAFTISRGLFSFACNSVQFLETEIQ